MNSLHDSSLCLDLQTGKPCDGLGVRSALEHPRSPAGGQAALNSEPCMALDSLLKASSADAKRGAAGNLWGLLI